MILNIFENGKTAEAEVKNGRIKFIADHTAGAWVADCGCKLICKPSENSSILGRAESKQLCEIHK